MAVLRNDPYPDQNFLVDLGDGETSGPQAGFQEVSGLSTSLDVIDYRTGNDRDGNVTKLTGLDRPADVVLKRGIIGSLALYQWYNAVRNGEPALRTVTIMLLNEKRKPVLVWKLLRARPIKLTFGPFNAKGTEVAMEELTLAYERLEME